MSRKHAVFTKDGERWKLEDQGSLNGTFVNRERVESADTRATATSSRSASTGSRSSSADGDDGQHPRAARLLTIGDGLRRLQDEFPDVSISKIRYLEDQGLCSPRRTQGGYRLFSEDDVERLETILRLQRDEFLPLRVIKEELERVRSKQRRRRRSVVGAGEEELDLEELCERAGITAERARELEEYGLLESRVEDGQRIYGESEADIAAACEALGVFGIGARNLRAFRTAADRESSLLEAVLGPALRSRNAERRAGRARRPPAARAERPGARRTSCCGGTSATWWSSLARMTGIDLTTRVREVPDFPEPGVGFKDISPLLLDPEALRQAVGRLADVDARAQGGPRARRRGARLLARRGDRGRGRLRLRRRRGGPASSRRRRFPRRTRSSTARTPSRSQPMRSPSGARVVIHDDVLATGGTVEAIAGLVEELGGTVVGVNFVIELSFLGGRERLEKYELCSLITY